MAPALESARGDATPSNHPLLYPAVEAVLAFVISAALLVPCFWQEHIQAGDLASHVYNAWLATRIEADAAPGLTLTHPRTNVLSDWALEALVKQAGAVWAERVVAGAAVLLFFWGAFYLAGAAAGKRPWLLAPCFAMLAYGLVFELGFLNFYVSTGICLWIMGLLWRPTRNRVLISLPLWALAILAHAMPVAWAGAVLAYVCLVRRLSPAMRWGIFAAGLAALAGVQILVMKLFPSGWSLDQSLSLAGLLGLTGAEQVFLSGPKYLAVAGGLVAIWCVLFLERLDRGGMMRDPVVQICILQWIAFVLAPSAVQLPQYQHVLAYIPQRLSLFNALFVCAMLGGARQGRGITRLAALIATVYFTFLFLDGSAFNRIEDQVSALVETLPPEQRVVAEIGDSNSRLGPLLHIADRACIGRCFSYGNYEPATGQFRIRVAGPNPAAPQTMKVVKEIEEGRHVVTPAEAPIYSVCQCPVAEAPLCLRRLPAGEKVCSFSLPVSSLWGLAWRPGTPAAPGPGDILGLHWTRPVSGHDFRRADGGN